MEHYQFLTYDSMKGFTLIELVVCIAIIGILVAIVMASLSTGGYQYKICGVDECHYIDSYTREDNCIFMSEIETRVCGDYTIKKNK